MATYVYLSNDPSDLSGYLKAYINERSPNASSGPSTAVTNTADVTSTTIAMTLTAGGSAAKWITVPFQAATTISTRMEGNLWGLESNASANAQIGFGLSAYTTSLQSAFVTTSNGAELTTSAARVVWVSTNGATANTKEVITSTSFAAGDRLAIVPVISPIGVMNAGYTVTMDYNQVSGGSDGDTYLVFNEDFQPGQAQVGSGVRPGIKGKGVSYFWDLQNTVQNAVNEKLISDNATAQAIINEGNYEAGLS